MKPLKHGWTKRESCQLSMWIRIEFLYFQSVHVKLTLANRQCVKQNLGVWNVKVGEHGWLRISVGGAGNTVGLNSTILRMITRLKLNIWGGQVLTIQHWPSVHILAANDAVGKVSDLDTTTSLRTYGSIVQNVASKLHFTSYTLRGVCVRLKFTIREAFWLV